jgi:rare lipoprotein A
MVASVLVACTSSPPPQAVLTAPPFEPADGPPPVVPSHLATLPDPEVVALSPSRYGNPPTYTVDGQTYAVMTSASGYSATGLASWYGNKFHGRRTSSGEPFDMFALTAAHRSLPIPAFARVTNLDNGLTTIVRINDRGPFHSDRLIDLSYAAAVKLGFADRGTARVRVDVLEPPRRYYLQAGAFGSLAAADSLRGRIEAVTGQQAFVVKIPDDTLYRVRVGPVQGHSEAVRLQGAISGAALAEPLILPF